MQLSTLRFGLLVLLSFVAVQQSMSLVETRTPRAAALRSSVGNGNPHVRQLYDWIRGRVNQTASDDNDVDPKQWNKLRSYLYRSAERLSMGQVDSVCTYLETVLDRDTCQLVLQTQPRILRKTVQTNLEPTVSFLRDLYGDQLLRVAIRRNPTLLLTRGAGYDISTMDLVPIYFTNHLNFTHGTLNRLKQSAPHVFQSKASKVIQNSEYLKSILLLSLSESDAQRALERLVVRHPALLLLRYENLDDTFRFLQQAANVTAKDASLLIRSSPSLLGFSPDHLQECLTYLQCWLDDDDDLRNCLIKHPPILCLSISNLRSKVEYLQAMDAKDKNPRDSLASRVLKRAPAAFSLSISSLRSKVDLLMRVWGTSGADPTSPSSPSTFPSLLAEDPTVLTLSLERNLRPTLQFYNRTGYIHLDDDWRLLPEMSPVVLLRPRYISASLSQRLLPRWYFAVTNGILRLPLHVLASSTDAGFCEHCGTNVTLFKSFVRRNNPQWKSSFQFDLWLQHQSDWPA